MLTLVLGSAAGGGFPQWNCNTNLCRSARYGKPATKARTQSSIAVSANGKDFVLFNASPDLRQQINDNQALHPSGTLRDSPIRAVVLTNGDVDHIAGLLTMRERHAFVLYAADRVQKVLRENSIFQVLQSDCVTRKTFQLGEELEICGPDGNSLGVAVTPFAVPGKVALYLEDESSGENFGTQEGDTIGLQIRDTSKGTTFYYIPGCAQVDNTLKKRLQNAQLVLFDGTLFENDEMVKAGVGEKTGARMGHTNLSGEDGSLQVFKSLNVGRKIYIHINNTNPILNENSAERKLVEKEGWEIAYDGMEIKL